MNSEDRIIQYKYTGPKRLDKAIHTLEGLIKGIAIDGRINEEELTFLHSWIDENALASKRHPFNEIIPVIENAISNGMLDTVAKDDIIWLCSKFTTDNAYFSAVTSDLQRLQAIVSGIAADHIITKDELEGLKQWMADHEHLRTCWPFEEIEGLISATLEDGLVNDAEQKALLSFFDEFAAISEDQVLREPLFYSASNIFDELAVSPVIIFQDKWFCFTGYSGRASRNEIARMIKNKGGYFIDELSRNVDYLVIGTDSNPCWAFTCYGRKVETAIQYKKEGSNLLIVKENDLWAALELE